MGEYTRSQGIRYGWGHIILGVSPAVHQPCRPTRAVFHVRGGGADHDAPLV